MGYLPDEATDSIYSDKLRGLEYRDCTAPRCAEIAPSTGWLRQRPEGDWCIEFDCPTHGLLHVRGGGWQTLIDEVVASRG